jgi:D-alanine-D-alanine ligase
MDKEITKAVFRQAGLPVVASLVTRRLEWERSPNEVVAAVEAILSYPVFVKPANLGSSVGVTKVAGRDEIPAAMEEAFLYDSKVLVEQGVDAREIEVSVLGHDEPAASVPGEIVLSREFTTIGPINDDTSSSSSPPLGERKTDEAESAAIAAFRARRPAWRDDFFERRTERLWSTSHTTGFTSIGAYPAVEASDEHGQPGQSPIQLAIQKQDERLKLKTDYPRRPPRGPGDRLSLRHLPESSSPQEPRSPGLGTVRPRF